VTTNVTEFPVHVKDHSKVIAVAAPFVGCQHRRAIVDPKLLDLTCADCGERLNAIHFLVMLAGEETMWEHRRAQMRIAAQRLDERKRCRCTHCGEWTEIRRVGNRELGKIRSSPTPKPPE
jgi:hypothetical protein